MSTSRRGPLLAAATLTLGLGAAWLFLPAVFVHQAQEIADQASSFPELVQRLQERERAAEHLRKATWSAAWTDEVNQAQIRMDAQSEAELEEQRLTLSAGAPGAQAHLDWLAVRAARPELAGERARMAQVLAWTSYGRFEEVEAALATPRGPFGIRSVALTRLWQGRLSELPGEVAPMLPAQILLRSGPADTQAPAEPLLALLTAERARRGGRLDDSRRMLLPLLDHSDEDLAAAASWSLARGLLDQAKAPPEGLAVVGVKAEPDAAALLALRARLYDAADDDPRWTAAWLALSEIEAQLGRPEAALEAIWAAIGASMGSWAPPPAAMTAQLRLDSPGALNPELAARPRLLVGEARLAALGAGLPTEDLAQAEAALLLLQGRGFLAAQDHNAARDRFGRAAELVPASPTIIGWRALTELLADRPDQAKALLADLPELHGTADDEALRLQVQAWLSPPSPTRVDAPARALRTRLRERSDPFELLAFAQAHQDRGDDLMLALRSPPSDRVELAQALAQSALWGRAASAIGREDEAAQAETQRAALSAVALSEPLWALFGLGAFSLDGEALPPLGGRER